MSRRPYRLQKRARAVDDTRNRIVWATMQLHAEKGSVATSQADVAERSGVAPATVYRHFPTPGSLIRACGIQTWAAVTPPRPEDELRIYAGLDTTPLRLERFVEEVSDFYSRAWGPLDGARGERSRVPELDESLRWVEAGLEALARKALAPGDFPAATLHLVLALTDFGTWKALRDHGFSEDAAEKMLFDLVRRAVIDAAGSNIT